MLPEYSQHARSVSVKPVEIQKTPLPDFALQHFGQKLRQTDALLFGLTGEVFPDAALDRGGHQDLRVRREVMEDAMSEKTLRRTLGSSFSSSRSAA